jgi:hypothetical protein
VDHKGIVLANLLERTYGGPKTITMQVDLGIYKAGLYYLHFTNGSKQQMKAVIKN